MNPLSNPYSPGAGTPPPELAGRERHAGIVRPGATAMLAALAAAALSAAGVSLFHSGENSLMVLLWHVGAVALLSLASLAFGARLFAWIGYAPRSPGRR